VVVVHDRDEVVGVGVGEAVEVVEAVAGVWKLVYVSPPAARLSMLGVWVRPP